MRTKIPDGKMVVQCPNCLTVGIKGHDGRVHRVPSTVIFSKLPNKICFLCKDKKITDPR